MRSLAEGKTVKILCVGKKGYDILSASSNARSSRSSISASIRQLGFGQADLVGEKIRELYDKGDFDVCTLFFSTFRSVIAQIPTAQRLIPAEVPKPEPADQRIAYDYEPDEAGILASSCRATSPFRCCGRCSRTTPPTRARG